MIKHIERLKQELIEISEMQNNKPIIPICVDFDGTVVTRQLHPPKGGCLS